MNCRALLVAGLLLVVGCSVGERPTLTDEALGVADGSDGSDGSVDGASDPALLSSDESGTLPDIDQLGDAPLVLLTPTGVLVPVVDRSETGYLVRTPCGNETEIAWGQPVDSVEVVLDPGHGGDEEGALGPSGESEAEVNLDVARRTAAELESRGFTVALTRTADYRIPIRDRAAIADRLQADVFVSIHHNSPTPSLSEDRQKPGSEVYVQAASPESERLGGLVYEEVIEAFEVFDADWASRSDAGVLTVLNEGGEDAYGINRHPATTSVLAELAYLSNPTEAVVIGTSEYRQAAAEALAAAIARFFDTEDAGSGYIDEPRLFEPSSGTGGTEGCVDPVLE